MQNQKCSSHPRHEPAHRKLSQVSKDLQPAARPNYRQQPKKIQLVLVLKNTVLTEFTVNTWIFEDKRSTSVIRCQEDMEHATTDLWEEVQTRATEPFSSCKTSQLQGSWGHGQRLYSILSVCKNFIYKIHGPSIFGESACGHWSGEDFFRLQKYKCNVNASLPFIVLCAGCCWLSG